MVEGCSRAAPQLMAALGGTVTVANGDKVGSGVVEKINADDTLEARRRVARRGAASQSDSFL